MFRSVLDVANVTTGAPSIPLNWFATNRLSCGENGPQKGDGPFMTASPIDVVAMSVRFPPLEIGVQAIRLSPIIAWVLQDDTVNAFRCLPLF